MTISISLNGVTLDYAIYSVRAQSLRNAVLNMAVGGKLMKGSNDVTVVRALNNVSFTLREGDRLGLVGHNGSGKTSMLKVLAGVYEPTGGRIRVDGRVSSMISMSIGLDHDASGIQNIRNLAMMQQIPKKEIERRLPEIISFSELGAYIHMPFKTYSAGMMARLTFSVATALNADILIMDEWISAGDAEFQQKAAARMASLVDEAKIVVIASHDMSLIKRVCNKVMVMEGGQATFFGSTEEWIRLTT
ncbi:ABC transporter ATP-binding protein [Caulobacter sp. UNC279MFTsu5.1]|uniref:ABC transporter ATP-binding protein n=1 Tax=Caulobacter sp. UNC279MFTsu5.1 TaxID=1502775 RepID=UPI0003676531|nr:ABC transporter ATP-binding protein [Caulobacter sp. UNC279MFTsu5.1]SFJ46902.1 lipopolysaccharide transport system ATP-binding protein [Caulobacter sp. UNC279MFTsu5.1]